MNAKKIFLLLVVGLSWSCGPRTGIHEENKIDSTSTNDYKEIISTTPIADAHDSNRGRTLYKKNCAVCHLENETRLMGPGLKNVLLRLPAPSEEYFIKYISDSQKLILEKDTYALKLHKKSYDKYFHKFEKELSEIDIKNLLAFMKTAGKPVP